MRNNCSSGLPDCESRYRQITTRFVLELFLFSCVCTLAKWLLSDEADYMPFLGKLIGSVERLFYLALAVSIASVALYGLWNFVLARLSRTGKLALLESASIVLLFSLIDPDGIVALTPACGIRIVLLTLLAGFFLHHVWQRLLSDLLHLRPWNYLESVTAFAMLMVVLSP